jgi:predicted dithiol-disulfide oxidoreductase (DUF899 family)
VIKDYEFETAEGKATLAQLFGGRSQLLIYHFMLAPGGEAGCRGCSFWADNFDGVDLHLAQRDITFLAVSRAPLPEIERYRQRMGWRFRWVSSHGSDFNVDYQASFTAAQVAERSAYYNYQMQTIGSSDMPGISAFALQNGQVFHTYSAYSRGIDMLNGAYHLMDLTSKGRDEGGKNMSWLKRHDEYGA